MTFGRASEMIETMAEKWRLKGVDWGRLMIDGHGLPEVAYAPGPRNLSIDLRHSSA